MGHAGARGTFISLFITLKPVAMMKKKEASKSSRTSLRFPNRDSQSQLQAAAIVAIKHEYIWMSHSSNMGKTDCPTNNCSQLGDRECWKGGVRWS